MKNRSIIKTLTRKLVNKTIFERAGLSARAYLTPAHNHTLAIFPDTTQAATFTQDFRTLYPEQNIFMLNELPLTSEIEGLRALLLERGETLRRWNETKGILAASPGALISSCLIGGSELKIKLSGNLATSSEALNTSSSSGKSEAEVKLSGSTENLEVQQGVSFSSSQSEKFNIDKIKSWLELSGYKRSSLVWAPGQYVQRGFILDVFDPGYSMPLRFEFFDDEIERIGSFHPDTQKSSSELMKLDEITLHSITQSLPKFPVELLPHDTLVIFNEPDKIEAQAESFIWLWREVFTETEPAYNVELWPTTFNTLAKFPIIRITNNPEKSDGEFMTEALPAFKGNPESILLTCAELEKNKFTIKVFTNNPVFQKLPYEIHDGVLSAGFIDKNKKTAFISERELSGINANISLTQWRTPNEWNDIEKLTPGQLVIHEDYGTGIFRGIETIDASGMPMDMLVIEFADDQRLLIPVMHSFKITGLNEHESEAAKLDSLKSKVWKKNYQKSQEKAQQEAKILMEIFAHRELERRAPFDEPGEMYNDFVKAFPYNETADQLKAINEIMKDLSSNYPMDRLLVGDVGFGKTEVAMRAAFRVVQSGFQVCVLVPTTILAQQHYTTFQSRLAGFPVIVGLLSRFITAKQAKETLNATAEGKIDILIGTHKLLQNGVKFKKLGLLIIDEEHRFGVMHKESLKLTYGSVDILSLSATPIPRTLAMSLRGLRSISVLSTPPEDRLPVTTYTGSFSPATIRRAITFELNRGGQVYFLSNKISRIPEYLRMLQAFFPEAKIMTAHGQMKEKELEATMLNFYAGNIDILLATTIIESGLDVGRANTIIIDNSEELGLAQMYQLRGRVGRRGEKAFAYFFYPNKAVLNQDTLDRLEAIATMTDLGSGYEIARRDLDIRGGGEIGGTTQHGNLRNSSFNIFYRMLEQELNKLRGIEETKTIEVVTDKGNGFIPENYIPQDDVRITLYRRLINVVGLDELEAMKNEMRDRFGKIPAEVEYLTALIAVRNFGMRFGIESVNVKKGMVNVKCPDKKRVDGIKIYLKALGRNLKFIIGE
ncbi:MAG: DEAD/DEAH box helicase [Synergistaceae bacterium]|nr:DEAD/DEAH box helicase [Synergistaceae bacterium]